MTQVESAGSTSGGQKPPSHPNGTASNAAANAPSNSPHGAGPNTAPASNAGGAVASRFAKAFPRLSASYQKFSGGRFGQTGAFFWRNRRGVFITLGLTYTGLFYLVAARDRYIRDYIHDNTYLVWKIYPGSIVETRSPAALSSFLLAPNPGEEAPKVLELWEAIRALKFAQQDPRVKGIFADFSSLHVPSSVSPEPLGLAQIEELQSVIHEFKASKKEQLQDEKARVAIAWSDSFESQGSYLLASAFDEVYTQPTGSVPLTGLSAQVTFFRRLLNWAGIKVHAIARKEYKSMVSPFTEEESLPPAQAQNEADLFGELNRSMCHMIGVGRWSKMEAEAAEKKVVELAKNGPYSAREALEAGLIDGVKYKRELVESLFSKNKDGENEDVKSQKVTKYGELRLDSPNAPKFKSLYDYNRVNNKSLDASLKDDEIVEVGVVYLNGTIASASASSVIKGLNEVADDDDIRSCILRIDSGGGDVVASESIWDAVRRVKTRKPIVASFGNVSASGGYYAATAASAITAAESTITGSIGVASLRPVITKTFFDRLGIAIQSFFTGSTAMSVLHEMDDEQKARQEKHIDETYEDFLQKVSEGRRMTRDEADSLAGGKVWTGLSAFVACNKDEEAEVASEVESSAIADGKESVAMEPATGEDDKGGSPPSAPVNSIKTKKVKLSELTYEWTTQDATTPAGNRVTLIMRKKQSESPDVSDLGSLVKSSTEDAFEEIPEASVVSLPDEQSQSQLAKPEGSHAEEKDRKPFGSGLIDMLGGIYDAAFLSLNLGIQADIEKLILEGKTMEQAMAEIRPGCAREIQGDQLTLSGDLRLVKYPADKPFWRRVRDMNRKGDQPQLSLAGLKDEFAAMVARAALKALARSALETGPSDIVQAFQDSSLGTLGKSARIKMQHYGAIPHM